MKHARLLSFLLAALLVLSSCSIGMADSLEDAAEVSVDTSEMFTDRDLEIGYDEEDSAYITLSNDSSTTTSPAVAISGNTVTIQGEGVYILSGSLSDGMIIVDAPDTDKVQLVLNGVTITSATSAAIYVREADKVFITTAAGTDKANQYATRDRKARKRNFRALWIQRINAAVRAVDAEMTYSRFIAALSKAGSRWTARFWPIWPCMSRTPSPPSSPRRKLPPDFCIRSGIDETRAARAGFLMS